MATKRTPPEVWPKVIETYQHMDAWRLDQLVAGAPSCLNGEVRVSRYRITVEPIVEPTEVLAARVVHLWRTQRYNQHQTLVLRAAGKLYGCLDQLTDDTQAIDCKK